MRLEAGPLGVGEVGLVCFSHARYPTERVPQNPFSDSFLKLSDNSRKGSFRTPERGHNEAASVVSAPFVPPNTGAQGCQRDLSDSFNTKFAESPFHALG